MNCLEFRRRILIDPTDQGTELLRHSRECGPCAAYTRRENNFAKRLRQAIDVDVPKNLIPRIFLHQSYGVRKSPSETNINQKLRRALEVDVPENLISRILLHQSFDKSRIASLRRGRWLALAASVMLTVSVATGYSWLQNRTSLEQAVLHEVYNELKSRNSRDIVPVTHVNDVWQPIGAAVDKNVGTMNFVSRCPLRDSYAGHLIVPGIKGPVSVIVMPDEIVRFSIKVRNKRFTGIIVPSATGSIAFIGETGESLNVIEERVRKSVRYQF